MIDGATAAICSILFLAALTRSSIGFGDALIAMPLMALVVDIKTAAPLMGLISITVAAMIMTQDWREKTAVRLGPLLIPGCIGVPLGVYFLKSADATVAKAGLASVIVLFSLYSLFKPARLHLTSDRFAPLFAFASGTLGGAFNTQGPPIVIYAMLRDWSPQEFRAGVQRYFFPVGLLILAFHCGAGFWSRDVFSYYGCAILPVIAAILIGKKINRRIPKHHFARVVYVMLLMVAALLLWQCFSRSNPST